jgi:kynureninase
MVDYPIEVKLGGAADSIEKKADFINNYDAIMIKAVRDAVLNQNMNDIFVNRQGVMLTDGTGEGRIWLMGGSSLGIIKIVSDCLNFPSDLYILQSFIHLLGDRHQLDLVSSPDGITPDLDQLFTSLDEHTALVCLSHVAFKSGYLYDAASITARAHRVGALVLWDVCHSVGALPVELDAWGADLAVGCTYKYLNGGPGAPAFLYVRRDWQEIMRSPIWGWFGERAPFDFALEYAPASGITRFLVSSPPVLSLLAMEASLDLILQADIAAIRRKSLAQTAYLVALVDQFLAPLGFSLGSPRQPEGRGSHVSLRHPDGYRINRALIEDMRVIPDFRHPDNIRLGLAPLYTTYNEIWQAVQRLRHVVQDGLYHKYGPEKQAVT